MSDTDNTRVLPVKVLTLFGEVIRPGMAWTEDHITAVQHLHRRAEDLQARIDVLGPDFYRLNMGLAKVVPVDLAPISLAPWWRRWFL